MAQRAETTVDEPSLSSCMSARLTDKFNVQSVVKIIPGQKKKKKKIRLQVLWIAVHYVSISVRGGLEEIKLNELGGQKMKKQIPGSQ